MIIIQNKTPNVKGFEFNDYQYYVDSFPSEENVGNIIDAKDAIKKAEKIWIKLYGESIKKENDNVDRIEVERFFSLEKGSNGGALITAKLEETVLHSIALAVFVTNLFMKKSIRKATERYFFVLFFSDGVLQSNEDQFIIIEKGV